MVESRQHEALALISLFPVLAAIFVFARTWSRYLGRNFGWDDWLIHISMALLLGETISSYQYVLLSRTGFHTYDLPKQTVSEKVLGMKWSFAVQMFYHPMMGAIRASIIMFLFRVKDKRWHIETALHIVFWINIGYMVSTSIVNIFQCTPVRYAYEKPAMDRVDASGNVISGGKCIDSLHFILASCALSIFMDLIIIPIPTAMVWNLQMRRKTKIAVVVIMSMGWLATAVSVGRFIVYYYRYAPSNKDRTWDIGITISIVEPSVGIMAACAPAMKCLFRRLMPRYFTEYTSYPTRNPTADKSRPQRSLNFEYGVGKELGDRMDAIGREEEVYGMAPLGSIDSREHFSANTTPPLQRTKSVKTGQSEGHSEGHSDTAETVPRHFLNHAH